MKNLVKAFIIINMYSCSSAKNIQGSQVGLVTLDNYFAKNTVTLAADTNYYAFTNQQAFDNIFGVAKTATNTIITPDFHGQTAVAVILKPTNKNVSVKILKAEMGGKNLNVYYSILNNGNELSYTQTPMAVATVPKGLDVKYVNFFVLDTKVKTIPLVY